MFPIRAVEDDHVDRPGVEVRQRMKLTGTNSSIGLIVLIARAHLPLNAKAFMRHEPLKNVFKHASFSKRPCKSMNSKLRPPVASNSR